MHGLNTDHDSPDLLFFFLLFVYNFISFLPFGGVFFCLFIHVAPLAAAMHFHCDFRSHRMFSTKVQNVIEIEETMFLLWQWNPGCILHSLALKTTDERRIVNECCAIESACLSMWQERKDLFGVRVSAVYQCRFQCRHKMEKHGAKICVWCVSIRWSVRQVARNMIPVWNCMEEFGFDRRTWWSRPAAVESAYGFSPLNRLQ